MSTVSRSVFRTLPNIYDEVFFSKIVKVNYFRKKSSILDVWQGSGGDVKTFYSN